MKKYFFLLITLITSTLFSQNIPEKSIQTEVEGATVFLKGAQIFRNKKVSLNKGISILKFTNLSPFIDPKSIQVKADGEIMVLTVNHQQNYLNEKENSEAYSKIENRLESINDKIELENTYISIIKEEIKFLNENRDVSGKNKQINVSNLQQASEFYGNKLTRLKLKEIERTKNLKDFFKIKSDLQNQINTITKTKDYPSGEILVKIDAKQATTVSFYINYLVANASWFPSYDIRAKNVNEPVNLVYKANVKQNTKVDWKSVKLSFSSGNPSVSGVAPELKTYYLNYNSLPPSYLLSDNNITGTVLDEEGLPLPGVNVIVDGTTIGTSTDFDGHFSITVPNANSTLSFSFVGFKMKKVTASSNNLRVVMNPDTNSLDEVVVVGYGRTKRKNSPKKLADKVNGIGVNTQNTSIPIPSRQKQNQTNISFEIDMPYTINSDNKNYSVAMTTYNIPTFYQYYTIPKIKQDAFLIANIENWEEYNLLEGEATVFFENTYIGKTLLNLRAATDTLKISMGIDKKIAVNRKKVTDFTEKQFIGSKKIETKEWQTTIKNTKKLPINIIVLDQVPVSTLEDIEVEIEEISGGILTKETGEVKWNFKLQPNKEKIVDLKYSAKYYKNKTIILE
ncbi:DUF4139 domain-containing protein [Zunongwangia sp.]|uniref:DUF4139 domain-containing protein n=1 Tax=Zunongwangia sp. TaxID=1965325 RepID=UPI003AA7CCE9